jgi:hypothetical protein
MWKSNMTNEDAAQVIERFLEECSLYPQEWNDFVETSQQDQVVDDFRRQCAELEPLVNRPGKPDPNAVAQLKQIIRLLRASKPQD